MFLLNSILTLLVLEKVGAAEFAAVKPIMEAVDSSHLNADKDIIMKISPDAIFKSFQAVVSSDYLRNLAEDFAEKAAAHFMTIIKGSEDKTFRQDKFDTRTNSRPPNDTQAKLTIPPAIKKKEKHSVNKKEVLVLLREPAIDGDNLEQALSEEITETTDGNTVRLKINGAYYKRHNHVTRSLRPLTSRVVSPHVNSTEEPKTTKMMEALKTTNTTTEKPKSTTLITTK